MQVNQAALEQRVATFVEWYGAGGDGDAPTAAQWRRLLARPADTPVTLVNFFKLRERAAYADGAEASGSGQEAFARYAAVSMPTMERVGGRFLFVGPHQGAFLGAEEDWDVVAIGAYPNLAALIALYADDAYRAAFHHRTAACARQRVLVCGE